MSRGPPLSHAANCLKAFDDGQSPGPDARGQDRVQKQPARPTGTQTRIIPSKIRGCVTAHAMSGRFGPGNPSPLICVALRPRNVRRAKRSVRFLPGDCHGYHHTSYHNSCAAPYRRRRLLWSRALVLGCQQQAFPVRTVGHHDSGRTPIRHGTIGPVDMIGGHGDACCFGFFL